MESDYMKCEREVRKTSVPAFQEVLFCVDYVRSWQALR